MGVHDRLFKELFTHFPYDLVSLALPWLQPHLGPGPPRLLPGELHRPRVSGQDRSDPLRTDLLMELPTLRVEDPKPILHVEIERTWRSVTPQRMRRYNVLLEATHGPRIVPLLVHLSGGQDDGVTKKTLVHRLHGEELGKFRYFSFSPSRCDAAEYLSRPEPLSAALAALMKPGKMTPVEHKLRCLERIDQFPNLSTRGRHLLGHCVNTYLVLDGDDKLEFEQRRKEHVMPEAEWNAYDHYLEVGMEQGLEQGLERGREEGARRVLMRLLQLRFGGLGPEARKRVEAIHSVDDLERMGERVLRAESLQEVLAPG